MTATEARPETDAPAIGVSKLRRLHHHAYPTRDQEATRYFMEDLLGIPLTATWTEMTELAPGTRPEEAVIPGDMAFCHTFYEMADGGALAFFQFQEPHNERYLIGMTNIFDHIALETDAESQNAIHERLLAAGVAHYIQDHGYCTSLYVYSPDGLSVEICVDPADVEDIKAVRREDSHSALERWLSGDYTNNNHLRGRSGHPEMFPGRVLYQPEDAKMTN